MNLDGIFLLGKHQAFEFAVMNKPAAPSAFILRGGDDMLTTDTVKEQARALLDSCFSSAKALPPMSSNRLLTDLRIVSRCVGIGIHNFLRPLRDS